jgi:hypothetical protein
VLPYFRTAINTLNHTEWKDAFSDDNIPSTLIDRSYHLLLTDSSTIKQNQDLIEINQPISVKLYVKGYRNTSDGRDRAIGYQEALIKEILETDRRAASYSGIKNVLYLGGGLEELSQDNDNLIRVTLNFNCYVIMAAAS